MRLKGPLFHGRTHFYSLIHISHNIVQIMHNFVSVSSYILYVDIPSFIDSFCFVLILAHLYKCSGRVIALSSQMLKFLEICIS